MQPPEPLPRAWLVTGSIARDAIDTVARKHPSIGVLVAPVSVASFITSNHVAKMISERPWIGESPIIVPGAVKWDVDLSDTPPFIVKGPHSLDELDAMLVRVSKKLRLYPDISGAQLAKEILSFHRSKTDNVARVAAIIEERLRLLFTKSTGDGYAIQHHENERVVASLRHPGRNFLVPGTSIVVGRDFPPAIMAEIINAPEKPFDLIEAEARHFMASGADIIDVGGTPGKVQPAELGDVIHRLIHDVGAVTSIDSMNEKEILAGVENGARVVLSIDTGNIDMLDSLPRDVVLVLIPTNTTRGVLASNPRERVDVLLSLVQAARDKGFTRLLADPILNSPITPGMMLSLQAFISFSSSSINNSGDCDIPLFIGGSNVSEMIDTDSTGVNALLAVMGVELGAGMLFTTEDSAKCLGSVREMRRGRELAFHALILGTYPKDLGISAINVKRKEKFVPSFSFDEKSLHAIPAASNIDSYQTDKSGVHVKIMVEHRKGRIVLGVFDKNGLVRAWAGTSAESMGKDVIEYFTLSPAHVLYIGRELAKAEQCLRHDVIYIQDA